jgi:hypothetical protein
MILDGSLTQVEVANVAGCSDRAIRNKDTNMRLFGNARAPANGAGRQRLITPPMLAGLEPPREEQTLEDSALV